MLTLGAFMTKRWEEITTNKQFLYVGLEIFPLIYEMKRIPKGGCEITAAYELVKELYKRQGHFCDIIVADALYAKANFINTVRKCHMDTIILCKAKKTMKLLKDMNGLCKNREPDVVLKNVGPQKKAKGTYYDVKI